MTKELLELNRIYNMECIEGMRLMPDKSVDMILCDLPYGTTACSWDTIVPFDKLWEQYERIIKDKGNIVLFGSQPFTSQLINSNLKMYKYSLVWNKKKSGNIFLAKYQPMKIHEDICIFYRDLSEVKHSIENYQDLRHYFKEIYEKIGLNKQRIIEVIGQSADHCFRFKSSQWSLPTEETYLKIQEKFKLSLIPYSNLKLMYEEESNELNNFTYNPQMEQRDKLKKSKNYGTGESIGGDRTKENKTYEYSHKNPVSILEFSNASQKEKVHPTQKPVSLFEYLIKTYSNEGQTVLDNCMGSGTTAIAAIRTNRKFIGFELEREYVEIANKRIDSELEAGI